MRSYNPREQKAYDDGYQAGLDAAARKDQQPLTMEDVQKMSLKEVMERKPEVEAVLSGGES